METTEAVSQFVTSTVVPLLGKRAWGAKLGMGSFITAELGEILPPTRKWRREHGEWHLWITYAAWRLERGSDILAACEDPRPKSQAAVESLNGLTLVSVDMLSPALDTLFVFDSDVRLRLFPVYSEGYEHWQLFTPDGNVLILGPGTSWTYQDASVP